MTARHVYVLTCDASDCAARFEANLSRADQTRQVALGQGWEHGIAPPNPRRGGPSPSFDYCPKHVALAEGLMRRTLPQHAREVIP